MRRILLALVISYVIIMGGAFTLGFLAHDAQSTALHFTIGLFTTVLSCFIHCVVITYFVIAGKMIKQAVLLGHLDRNWIHESQRRKGWVTGAGCTAVAVSLGAALLGAWTQTNPDLQSWRIMVHWLGEILAVSCNFGAFWLAYRLIAENGKTVDKVFKELEERSYTRMPGA